MLIDQIQTQCLKKVKKVSFLQKCGLLILIFVPKVAKSHVGSNVDFRKKFKCFDLKINVARFARNVVKWDIFGDFQTMWIMKENAWSYSQNITVILFKRFYVGASFLASFMTSPICNVLQSGTAAIARTAWHAHFSNFVTNSYENTFEIDKID